MSEPVTRESPDRFGIDLGELARKVVRGFKRGDQVQVDPYLIARAIAEVMRTCAFRTATGQRLLWNNYRMILARADYELVHALQGPLERDLGRALADEAAATGAELVGELAVSVVYDEADELRAGHAVVRVAFVPTERLQPAASIFSRMSCARSGSPRTPTPRSTTSASASSSSSRSRRRWPSGSSCSSSTSPRRP